MPNWCMNFVSLSHVDSEQIKKLKSAIAEEKLFETFVSNPSGEWDYFWSIENWGTKWEASNVDVQDNSENDLTIYCDTAWGPPIGFYKKMTELGFNIDATYHEPGVCFAGHYNSTDGDDSYEYDFSDENWRDEIDDEDVLDLLESEYESWKEWQDEEEEMTDLESDEDSDSEE